jgi:DNA-binding HxlR family transcriptional regulator
MGAPPALGEMVSLVDMDLEVNHSLQEARSKQSIDWRFARTALEGISGKWELAVLSVLLKGEHAHCDLLRATGLENKQLTRALHHLQEFHLIERRVRTAYSPVRVCYRLTRRGSILLGALVEFVHQLKSAEWTQR